MPKTSNQMYQTVEVRRFISGFKRGLIVDVKVKGISKSSVEARQKHVGTICYETGTGDRYELMRCFVKPMLEAK